jgi:hypothetical protein
LHLADGAHALLFIEVGMAARNELLEKLRVLTLIKFVHCPKAGSVEEKVELLIVLSS